MGDPISENDPYARDRGGRRNRGARRRIPRAAAAAWRSHHPTRKGAPDRAPSKQPQQWRTALRPVLPARIAACAPGRAGHSPDGRILPEPRDPARCLRKSSRGRQPRRGAATAGVIRARMPERPGRLAFAEPGRVARDRAARGRRPGDPRSARGHRRFSGGVRDAGRLGARAGRGNPYRCTGDIFAPRWARLAGQPRARRNALRFSDHLRGASLGSCCGASRTKTHRAYCAVSRRILSATA